MVNDVRRAFFYAKAMRPAWIELPAEDYDEGDEAWLAKLANIGFSQQDVCDVYDAIKHMHKNHFDVAPLLVYLLLCLVLPIKILGSPLSFSIMLLKPLVVL